MLTFSLMVKDVYIITYGTKWGWRFESSIVQKIYDTKEGAIHYGKQKAKEFESDVYVEQPNGKYKKLR